MHEIGYDAERQVDEAVALSKEGSVVAKECTIEKDWQNVSRSLLEEG